MKQVRIEGLHPSIHAKAPAVLGLCSWGLREPVPEGLGQLSQAGTPGNTREKHLRARSLLSRWLCPLGKHVPTDLGGAGLGCPEPSMALLLVPI